MARLPALFFLNGERLLLELRERLRHLGELRVDDQADVLDRDRGAVEALDGRAVRERVERVRRELRLRVAFVGTSGSTEPSAASSPVQSCAPTITSGALSAWTVLRSSRILPKSFSTTSTFRPRWTPQAPATFVDCRLAVLVGPDPDRCRRAAGLRAPRRRGHGRAGDRGEHERRATQAPNAVRSSCGASSEFDPVLPPVDERFMPVRQPRR